MSRRERCRRALALLCLTLVFVGTAARVCAQDAADAPANPTVADPYLVREKGLRAMGQELFEAAALFFRDYRDATDRREPDFADATILLTRSYVMQEDYDKAAAALGYHKANSPGVQDDYYRNVLQYWRAAVARGQGKLEQAADLAAPLPNALDDREYRSLALQLLADIAVYRQDWTAAETYLRSLLKEFPDAANARQTQLNLIKVFLATDQIEPAEALIAMLEEDTTEADRVSLERAKILLAIRKDALDRAVELYEGIAAQRPKRPDADWWVLTSELASALFRANRLEQALAILPQVAALAPTEAQRIDAMLRTAEAQIALKKTTEAIDTLERFKKEFPDRPEVVPVLIRLAELLRETNNPLTAAEYFAQVMANEQAPVGFRYRSAVNRGWCLRDAGRFEDAAQAFLAGEHLGVTPAQKARAVFLAGDTAFGVSNYKDAAAYYAKVVETYGETQYAQEARFRQGRAFFELKEFDRAAEVYGQFVSEFPESTSLQDARLERGIALRRGADTRADYEAAMRELQAFAETYPESEKAPRALMEGYQAAMSAADTDAAVGLLSTIISKHGQGELFAHALYHRAMVQFMRADYDKAVADSKTFIETFGELPLAPDLMLQLGDYYANGGNFEQAKDYFSMLATKHPQSPLAPTALYEAALCSYRLEHLGSATLLLDQLLALESPTPKAETLARAELLYGDILARQDQYERALEHFSRARELGSNSRLGLAALGRRGEMLYSLASGDEARLPEAIECFVALTDGPETPADLWEIAMYRLGKCYEMAGDHSNALKSYLEIFYQYEHDRKQGKRRDYFYLVRSIYDAAHLLELTGKRTDLATAATLYEYLADLKLPTAQDAKRRAEQIREQHDLVNR